MPKNPIASVPFRTPSYRGRILQYGDGSLRIRITEAGSMTLHELFLRGTGKHVIVTLAPDAPRRICKGCAKLAGITLDPTNEHEWVDPAGCWNCTIIKRSAANDKPEDEFRLDQNGRWHWFSDCPGWPNTGYTVASAKSRNEPLCDGCSRMERDGLGRRGFRDHSLSAPRPLRDEELV